MAHWELIETDPDVRLLKLSGDWGVERAEELHQVLLQAVEGAKRLHVDMEGVAEVDLSFFQIMCSALKWKKNSEFSAVNVPEGLAVKARSTGFSPGCALENFWKGAVHGQTHHDRG